MKPLMIAHAITDCQSSAVASSLCFPAASATHSTARIFEPVSYTHLTLPTNREV